METTNITINNTNIVFYTPNVTCEKRARSILKKEPYTIKWLDSFNEGEVLLDIGANVGVYSLYGAIIKQVNVFAFEPESQNFAILNKNIVLNKINNKIVAFPIALSNSNEYTFLFLSKFTQGGSHNNIKQPILKDNKLFRKGTTAYKQGSVCSTIDFLIDKNIIPIPDHIKIDVDGSEPEVIQGSLNTLKKLHIKSILIEVETNRQDHMAMVDMIKNTGFVFCKKQVAACLCKSGSFKGQTCYIFYREKSTL